MIDIIVNPPNKPGLRIDQMWAAVSVDENGDEGLCAFYAANTGQWLPLIAADEARLESIRGMASALAQTSQYAGKVIKLIRLTTREELETFEAPREETPLAAAASPDQVQEFQEFANMVLRSKGGRDALIKTVEQFGAPVDAVELLETLRRDPPVLSLQFLPLPGDEWMMLAVRAPK